MNILVDIIIEYINDIIDKRSKEIYKITNSYKHNNIRKETEKITKLIKEISDIRKLKIKLVESINQIYSYK